MPRQIHVMTRMLTRQTIKSTKTFFILCNISQQSLYGNMVTWFDCQRDPISNAVNASNYKQLYNLGQ